MLTSNGYITDDFGHRCTARPAISGAGVDIYNEHLEYVDPHYLYPPGGTLLMAPFGYMTPSSRRTTGSSPSTPSRSSWPPAYW